MLTSGGSRALLSRRDRVYLFSLLIPFVVYNLILKSLLISSRPQDLGFLESFELMQSNLLFNLSYMVFWVALFALANKRLFRWIAVAFFHLTTIIIALITTSAYQYFKITGTALDADALLLGLYSEGTGSLIASGLTAGMRVLISAIPVYGLLGPPLVTYIAGRWCSWTANGTWHPQISWLQWLRAPGMMVVASALFTFSMLPGGSSLGVSRSFARDAFVNVLLTAVENVEQADLPSVVVEPTPSSSSEGSLLATASTERRNVVLIFLESTRADATTPYNEELATTPFMDSLAQKSLLVEQAYAIVGHTHNAITATSCGIEPPLDPVGTGVLGIPGSVLTACLPHLLKEQGYNTVYFMSHEKGYEDSEKILENLGYDDFYSIENMNTAGFARTYYWGYEDEIMLRPSREWLQANGNTPFLAAYLTSAPHHDYLAPQQRHGRVEFSTRDTFNHYLNSVRNQDFFLKSLFDQYKQMGLYENTVFVILGDHGEGFGEHGVYGHNMIYEEGVRIPFLVHDSKRFQNGARIQGPVDQRDVLPTVVDLLGYEIQGGLYGGSSLLQPLPDDRTLMFSCWHDKGCLASLTGTEKYYYFFDDRPEELFDLSTDPKERRNLARQRSPEELSQRRSQVLQWRLQVHTMYGTRPVQ